MIEIPKSTDRIYTRKCRIYMSSQQVAKFESTLLSMNRLHNFALSILERRYGVNPRKNRQRRVPTGKRVKILVAEIRSRFAMEEFGLTKWSEKDIGIPAQQAQVMLEKLVINFSLYTRGIHAFSKAPSSHKLKWEKLHKKSWWRKGSIDYIRDSSLGKKSITIPSNGDTIKFVDDRHIKLPTYGVVRTQRSLKSLFSCGDKLCWATIKRIRSGLYEIQLTFKTKVVKKSIQYEIGYDWGMKDDTMLHGTSGSVICVPKEISERADELEMRMRTTQAKLSRTKSNSYRSKLLRRLQRTAARRANMITDFHRKLAKKIASTYDLVAVEDLDPFSMRKLGSTSPMHKGFNRKLSIRKPGEFLQVLKSAVIRVGGTIVFVDPDMTSQVEFESGWVPPKKMGLSIRQWTSPVTGKIVDRDQNAAWNILSWGILPDLHYKHIHKGVSPEKLVEIY